jgi:glycosyltransferase involved in cell wall biosynthesis
MYCRWHPGQRPVELRDGYRIVRAPFDWRLAIPILRGPALRRSQAAMAAVLATEGGPLGDALAGQGGQADATVVDADSQVSLAGRLVLAPRRIARRLIRRGARRVLRPFKRWQRTVQMFPLRPMAWAIALDDVLEPADVWHGMWAGSLPALLRASKHLGGKTVYDSRDVYMLSRDFAQLERPLRDLLAWRERTWAHGVDRVLTVNEPYADLIATQLRVPRPPVVINCPDSWTPPTPAPDLIREALGLARSTAVVLYQGQLISGRGVEQAMEAILSVPDAVLVLMGFGAYATRYARLAASPPYEGRVFMLPPVPPSELLVWTASADALIMAIQPTTPNHRYTTPQKLWESIAAGVPVVASDLPGMAAIVRDSGVGVLVDPRRRDRIAAGIATLVALSPEERARLRRHILRVAHGRYNWGAQLDTLFGMYRELVPGVPGPAASNNAFEAARDPGGTLADARLPVPPGARLHLVATPDADRRHEPGETIVVLDTTWSAPDGRLPQNVVRIRDVVERVMRDRDLFAEASTALDGWADASDVADHLTQDGVSFWYGYRLRHWMWVVDHVVALAAIDRLIGEHPGTVVVEQEPGTDPMLAEAARLIARRDGLTYVAHPGDLPVLQHATAEDAELGGQWHVGTVGEPAPGTPHRRGPTRPFRTPEPERRRRAIVKRMETIRSEPQRRLLVVQAHARQRIDTSTGPRFLNVYLAPVVERLRQTRLEPYEFDLKANDDGDADRKVVDPTDAARVLPHDTLELLAEDVHARSWLGESAALRDTIVRSAAPLVLCGVDVGPRLAEVVANRVGQTWARRRADTERITRFLKHMRPAGILMADEYHRQDWLAAARAEHIPVIAIQHGVIYRWHNGYMHASRPESLRLPDRTYVFGQWERDLLVGTSVYAPEEVVVGGSPRLDLVDGAETASRVSRDTMRRELGVAVGDRLMVLSGTWGPLYRQYHYPIALANLFAEPVERLHVVVKLHPSEKDEGPYRKVIEDAAAAGRFPPPRITVVKDVDLYRLLAAADSHLGIHSTVLTEAVATGTPNLLAAGLLGADLLGYVDAGVAIPVETPADLRAALDMPLERAMPHDRRIAFMNAHFEPGSASARIASELLTWLG